MTDKLRQAAQQILEAVADLTILTPREWQAVHGLKINALRAALAEQPEEQEPTDAQIDAAACRLGVFSESRPLGQQWAGVYALVRRVVSERMAATDTPQPAKREPVAYMHCPRVAMDAKVRPVLSFEKYEGDYASGIYAERIPLYTHPQPAKREPLTWDELDVLWEKQRSKPFKSHGDDLMEFARAIERAHGIGGQS